MSSGLGSGLLSVGLVWGDMAGVVLAVEAGVAEGVDWSEADMREGMER